MLTMAWKKSSFSGGSDDNCLEARLVEGGAEVRNSKNPDGPAITYTTGEWAAFVAGVKDGQFDI
jgi:hypothetical protein